MCHAYWNIFWDRKKKKWPLWHDFSPIVIFRIFICFKFLGRKRNRLAYRKVRQATKKTRNWENGGAKCSQNTFNTFSAKISSEVQQELKITIWGLTEICNSLLAWKSEYWIVKTYPICNFFETFCVRHFKWDIFNENFWTRHFLRYFDGDILSETFWMEIFEWDILNENFWVRHFLRYFDGDILGETFWVIHFCEGSVFNFLDTYEWHLPIRRILRSCLVV